MAIRSTDHILVSRDGTDYKALVQALLDIIPVPELSGALIFKGSVDTVDQLPDNAELGHFYVTSDSESYYAWNGDQWCPCGNAKSVDLSHYASKDHGHAWSEITGKPGSYTPSGHYHNAQNINSGTLAIQRIPTGTTNNTVALGDHTHSGYASSSHTHSGYASSNHTHSGYASSSHTHSYASSSHNHNGTYVKGNYTISYSSGAYYIS